MVDPFALHVTINCNQLSLVSPFVARYHLVTLPPGTEPLLLEGF